MRRHLPEGLSRIRAGKAWICGDESFYFGLKGNFVRETLVLYQYAPLLCQEHTIFGV